MKKKAVVIYNLKNQPIYIASIRDLEYGDFIALQRECEKNQQKKDDSIDSLVSFVKFLEKEIENLKNEIKELKGDE